MALLATLAALIPLPHVHLGRYGGCLAPHSQRRGALLPTPRQQGVDGEDAHTGTPEWSWARRLGRVFALARAHGPWCQQGTLRLIAVITQGEVMRKRLRPLKRAADPPPITPARARQTPCDWVASGHDDTRGLGRPVRAVAVGADLRVCALPAQSTPLRLPPLPPARRGG